MTDNQNPYAAPQAKVIGTAPSSSPTGIDRLRAEPALLPAGAGAEWLGQSWALFKKAPALLIAMLVLYVVIGMGVELIPVIGGLFMSLAFGIWMAGWSITFAKLHRGDEITVADLFAGFSHPRLGRLFTIGALYLGMFLALAIVLILLAIIAFGFANFDDLGNVSQGDMTQVGERISSNFGALLVVILIAVTGVFLIIGYVAYAPVLVAMHDIPVLDACALSLRALLRNWLPMTVYGLILVGLFVASVFTLFIGLLVILPLMIGVGYVSYRQMFLEPQSQTPMQEQPQFPS